MTNPIWHIRLTLAQLNAPMPTLVTHLGIEITAIGDDFLKATMPVSSFLSH